MATTPWYQYGTINNWGFYPDPEGAFAKPDINIKAPAGTPFTAPSSGTITGLNTSASYGDVVTVAFDKPPNSVATHFAFLHLASINPNDFIGEHVSAGTVLGTGGGGVSKSGALPGFAFTDTASYGQGSANQPFSGTYENPLLNPTGFLGGINTGQTPINSPGSSPTGTCDPNAPIVGAFCSAANATGAAANAQLGQIGASLKAWSVQAGIVVLGAIIVIMGLVFIFKG